MEELKPSGGLTQSQRAELPVRRVTANSIVALNLAYFRKAAGLTQEELGELIGWGKTIVSTAERSWDAKRVRSFSAEDLIGIAMALGVPLAALFLPPEDHGIAYRYVLDSPGREGSEVTDLLAFVSPAYGDDSPVMDAYRKRNIAAGASLQAAIRQAGLSLKAVDGEVDSGVSHATDAEPSGVAEQARSQEIAEAGDETLEETTGDADMIVARARREAAQLVTDAQERAAALMREVNDVLRHRSELEQHVKDLREFERDYRARLQTLLKGQLQTLWEGTPGSDVNQLLKDLEERTAVTPGQAASVVVLREDGTYDVIKRGPLGDDEGIGDKDNDNEGLGDHDT